MQVFLKRGGRRAGWVADYCIICRDVHSHLIVHLKDSAGNAQPPVAECSVCGLRSSTNPARYVAVVPDEHPGKLSDLVAKTFPRLPLAVVDRVLWEKSAIEQRLQYPERQQAIQEPFLTVSYLTGRRLEIGEVLGVSIGFMFLLCFPLLIVTATFSAKQQDNATIALLFICIGCSIGCAWWVLQRRQRRKEKSAILPMLSRSLRPLRPTLEEVQGVLNWAKAMRQPVGQLFLPQELFDEITRQPDRSLVHAEEMDLIGEARRMHAELNAQNHHDEPADESLDSNEDFDSSH